MAEPTEAVVMNNLKPPEKLEFQDPNAWFKWKVRFERYLKLSRQIKKSDEDKIDLMLYLMGEKADDIFLTFKQP